MKSFVASLVALVVIGFGAYTILDSRFQKTADQQFVSSAARIDVGKH
jgi:hypothetical protein